MGRGTTSAIELREIGIRFLVLLNLAFISKVLIWPIHTISKLVISESLLRSAKPNLSKFVICSKTNISAKKIAGNRWRRRSGRQIAGQTRPGRKSCVRSETWISPDSLARREMEV
jgi:hypothetical protein